MDWKNRLVMITNKVKEQLHTRKLDDLEVVKKYVFEFDFDGTGLLNKVDFVKFLSKSGIYLTTQELTCVYNFFEKNKDGLVDYNGFIQMAEFSEKRLGVVKYAFAFLDAKNEKRVTLDELISLYKPGDHPRIRVREKTAKQVQEEFLKAIRSHSSDGVHITEEEFLGYYADVNATLPKEKEEYFTDLVFKTWGITTGESYVSPERLQDLEIILYEKIRQKTFTHDDEGKTVKKAFKYFDLQESGVITLEQFNRALNSFGCVFSKHEVNSLFKKYDTENAGKLNYDQFCEIFARLGSGVNPSVNPIFEIAKQIPSGVIEQVRHDCTKNGLYGIRKLAHTLKAIDKKSTGKITRNEFLWALKENGTTINKHDLDKLYRYFDPNTANAVNYIEFINTLRGQLSPFREELISKYWARLDSEKKNYISFDLVKNCYDPYGEPDVRIGRTKPEYAQKEFYLQWNIGKDWNLYRSDFYDFYWDVSAGIEKDEAFESLIVNTWALGDDKFQNTQQFQNTTEKIEKIENRSKVRFVDQ